MCRIHKALPHSGSFSAPPCKKHGFGKEALDLLSIEEKLSIARIVRKTIKLIKPIKLKKRKAMAGQNN